jgi:hypothetical protein
MEQQRPGLEPGERIIVLQGRGVARMPHLCNEYGPIEYERKSDAMRAAARVNGIPYRSPRRVWLVRFEM